MSLNAARLKTSLDINLFETDAVKLWDKCISNAVIDKMIDPSVYTVVCDGIGGSSSPGVGNIYGIQGITQSTFYSYLLNNWKLYSELPGSEHSDIIGMQGISMIGEELAKLDIVINYTCVNDGTCQISPSGIAVEEDLIKDEIILNLKNADLNPRTRMYMQRKPGTGEVIEDVLEIQKRMAFIIARSIKENLAVVTGTGTIGVGGSGSDSESVEGVIS